MFRAQRELRECPAETAPLPDVADPLVALGISTVLVDMDEGISGLTLISADGNVLVAANRTHPILRRRFSFAHEYVHVLLDRDPRVMQVSVSVRYALADDWLLIKGESTRRNPARRQFPQLAKKLVYGYLRSHFQGTTHCQGCVSIKAAADGQPRLGSAEVWRRLGTIHHITEVSRTLRLLHGP